MAAASDAVRVDDRRPERDGPASSTRRTDWLDLLLDYGLYVAIVVEVVVFWWLSPHFLTSTNLLNIGSAIAVLGVIAAGLTIALVAGILDLSQTPLIAFTSIIVALLSARHDVPIGFAIAAALALAMAIGLLNAGIVVGFGINSIIATLAVGTIVGGLSLLLTDAQPIGIPDAGFNNFFFHRVLEVPLPVIILVAVYVIAALLLYQTKLGWHIYATGGNASAARRAGIPTIAVWVFVFVLSAGLSGVAGVMTAGLSNGGAANLGGDLLTAATAVLLGGIGLSGGGGRIERTLAGVVFLGVLNNGLILLQVQSFWGTIVRGVALLLAVIMVSVREKRMAR